MMNAPCAAQCLDAVQPLRLAALEPHALRPESTHRVLLQCLNAPMCHQGGHIPVPISVLNEAEEKVCRLLL